MKGRARHNWSDIVALVLLGLIVSACRAPSSLPSATRHSVEPQRFTSSVITPSPSPIPANTPLPTMGTPDAVPQSTSQSGAITPTATQLPVTPPASSGALSIPTETAQLEASITPLTTHCQASDPPLPQVPSDATHVALRTKGCIRLTIAPGHSYSFDTLALVANPPACAAAFTTFSWAVLSPSGAEVVVKTGLQGSWNAVGRGSAGTVPGYCGAIDIQNPQTQRVTLDLAYVLVEAS